ncbi:thioredoxin domain-containing protein [Amycolatopsis taiwanensis]|uniref:thioredoxin domain-containing protein n=1 Tax=Amycolatopsis taiwanensis TaxID=342230 RepID=UPI0004835A16|nr:thioredoxin domain-containing protein [Amycolatopsis taiwanensis]
MRNTARRNTTRRDSILVVMLVLAAAGLITYLLTGRSGEARPDAAGAPPGQEQPANQQGGPSSEPGRDTANPLAIGKPDAPVKMIMYSDFRCPFCGKFSRDTEPVLVDRYVQTGVLRIEWRDYPIFGVQSIDAARAGRAAAEQGRFWEFTRAVYQESPPTGHPDLTRDKLRDFAAKAGVPDLARFEADLGSNRFDSAIQQDLTEGGTIGVYSTPTFLINGRPLLGAQPLETFTAAIDEAAR